MSPKERKIMSLVAGYATTPGRSWPTIDELILKVGTATSKQAMQHTLRSLEEKGFIRRIYERRLDRVNLVVQPTTEGLGSVEATPI